VDDLYESSTARPVRDEPRSRRSSDFVVRFPLTIESIVSGDVAEAGELLQRRLGSMAGD